jgi:cobalamin synthase
MTYIAHMAVGLAAETGQYSTPIFSSPWLYVAVFLLIIAGYASLLYQKKYPLLRYNVVIALVLILCLLCVAFVARKQFQ